jgi:hypothetical protein
MNEETHFVAGGGWIQHATTARPRTRLFGWVSLLWIGVSLGASSAFWGGWPGSFGLFEWMCTALLLPHPVLVALALFYWRTESPRTVIEENPNPDFDLRKLY